MNKETTMKELMDEREEFNEKTQHGTIKIDFNRVDGKTKDIAVSMNIVSTNDVINAIVGMIDGISKSSEIPIEELLTDIVIKTSANHVKNKKDK